jgi:hypothetical protein
MRARKSAPSLGERGGRGGVEGCFWREEKGGEVETAWVQFGPFSSFSLHFISTTILLLFSANPHVHLGKRIGVCSPI